MLTPVNFSFEEMAKEIELVSSTVIQSEVEFSALRTHLSVYDNDLTDKERLSIDNAHKSIIRVSNLMNTLANKYSEEDR